MRKLSVVFAVCMLFLFSCSEKDTHVELTEIHLNETALTLCVGEEYQFNVSTIPSGTITPNIKWEVSPNNVATISKEGLLKATEAGEAILLATINADGKELSDMCQIIVKPISATGITINVDSTTLIMDEKLQLTYSLIPQNVTYPEVIWESSDITVATVSSLYTNNDNVNIKSNPSEGLVTAVGPGTAIITATVHDHIQTKSNPISTTCKIVVKRPNATGIEISTKQTTMYPNEEIQIKPSLFPENAEPINFIWKSSNPDIVSVKDGLCIGIKPGESIITVSSENGNLSAQAQIIIKPYKQTNITYNSKWGFDCTVSVVDINTTGSRTDCHVLYTLKNNTTDKVLNECTFRCITKNGEIVSQNGFFQELYPGESITRSYIFSTLASNPFVTLEFFNPFSNEEIYPDADDLKWGLN